MGSAHPLTAFRDLIPNGDLLDDGARARRHRTVCAVLALHLPALLTIAIVRDRSAGDAALVLVAPLAALVLGRSMESRRLAVLAVTTGLLASSIGVLVLSDGALGAHLHAVAVLAFVALYQDWLALVGVLIALGGGPALANLVVPDSVVGRDAGVVATALGLAAAGQALLWRAAQHDQRRTADIATELARTQSLVEQRESISELFVNLARRNQALLDRQISLLVAMEEREAEPDSLSELFQLDHLATRIRRNAESLLVLSGEEPARRWGRPVPLPDVVRAAVAEVEDYRRAEVAVDEGMAIVGRAVADLAHLLAELIENGLQFSPPESRVRITNHARSDGGAEVTIEDRGLGMSADDLADANDLVSRPPDVDLRLSKRLGFHVVARLAARYGVRVHVLDTPGGGITATVVIPAELMGIPEVATIAPPPPEQPVPAPLPPAPEPVVAALRPERAKASAVGFPQRIAAAIPKPAVRTVPIVAPPLVDPAALPVARRTAEVIAAPITPVGGLPRRVPQASIDANLRDADQATEPPPAPAPASSPAATPPVGRSREEVRAMLSSFQASQQRSRSEVATPREPEGSR